MKDRYNGLFYKGNDVDDLAKKVQLLADNRGLSTMMGNNNYSMYNNGHTFNDLANHLVKLCMALDA